jgi:hypothetical protein
MDQLDKGLFVGTPGFRVHRSAELWHPDHRANRAATFSLQRIEQR